MTQVTGGPAPGQWTYDGANNITHDDAGNFWSYSSTVPNELVQIKPLTQAALYTFAYDQRGGTISITNTTTLNTQLTYDPQARLSTVTLKDGTLIAQAYNAQGQRTSYSVTPPGHGTPTLTEQFQYRGGELAQVTVTGSSNYTDTYLYRQDGTPLELLRTTSGSTARYYYILDGQDNVVALTDSTGNVVDRYAYDVWGAPTSVTENVPQHLRYAGYWYDTELGWYWLSVRIWKTILIGPWSRLQDRCSLARTAGHTQQYHSIHETCANGPRRRAHRDRPWRTHCRQRERR